MVWKESFLHHFWRDRSDENEGCRGWNGLVSENQTTTVSFVSYQWNTRMEYYLWNIWGNKTLTGNLTIDIWMASQNRFSIHSKTKCYWFIWESK